MKTDEFLSDLMSHPALRAAPQAALESMPALNDPASPKLAPTVGTTAWGQALGEKLVWMTAGAQQTASLTLNPPNLGPLQIVLNVSNDQATASFFSAQPEVRQALEAAMPKLREMMDEAASSWAGDGQRRHAAAERHLRPARTTDRLPLCRAGRGRLCRPAGRPAAAPAIRTRPDRHLRLTQAIRRH